MTTRSLTRTLDFRSAIAAGVAALWGATVASTAAAQDLRRDVPVNVACFDRADEATLLDDEGRERLCRGADSAAPTLCFEAAKDRTTLDDDVAITLCRCARSTAPVACYERADRQSPSLEEDQRVASCRPIVVRHLFPTTCRPRPR